MHTARLTVLMPPTQKAEIARRAKKLGMSSGEFVRLATERFDEAGLDAELEALTRELEDAMPQMQASLESMERSITEARKAVRETLDRTRKGR